jgi:hypothetical protein
MQKRRFERWGSCRWWILLVGTFKVGMNSRLYRRSDTGHDEQLVTVEQVQGECPRCKVSAGAVCMCDSCADKEEQLTRKQRCDDLEYRCWEDHSQGSKQYQ